MTLRAPAPGCQVSRPSCTSADDTTVALATAVTDGRRRLHLRRPRLPASYKLRFTGAGFTPVWYEAGQTPDAATEVAVEAGRGHPRRWQRHGDRWTPGGADGPRHRAPIPPGAVATLVGRRPASTPRTPKRSSPRSTSRPTVQFRLRVRALPRRLRASGSRRSASPARIAPGSRSAPARALTDHRGHLAPRRRGHHRCGLRRRRAARRGHGGGHRRQPSPSRRCHSPSIDDRGTYALRNLAVPGRYTVTVSRDGYATESRNVVLDGPIGPHRLSTSTLASAVGSVAGTTDRQCRRHPAQRRHGAGGRGRTSKRFDHLDQPGGPRGPLLPRDRSRSPARTR